jgi:hypothetical protein
MRLPNITMKPWIWHVNSSELRFFFLFFFIVNFLINLFIVMVFLFILFKLVKFIKLSRGNDTSLRFFLMPALPWIFYIEKNLSQHADSSWDLKWKKKNLIYHENIWKNVFWALRIQYLRFETSIRSRAEMVAEKR